MIDMKIEPKSDQLNADDLIAGPRIITITEVKGGGGNEQPVSIFFEGDKGKPYKPCKSMRKIMVAIWGHPEDVSYVGKKMKLFLDPKVTWGGSEVGGIRFEEMSGVKSERKIPLLVTRGRKVPWTVKPLVDAPSLQTTEEQITVDEAQQDARQAAEGGADAFSAWWNTNYGKSCREQVKPIMDELKDIAARSSSVSGGDHNG